MTRMVEIFENIAKISTHTPTWGVTNNQLIISFDIAISTHTPTWGVTGRVYMLPVSQGNFNSHAHVGRDLPDMLLSRCLTNFNSHAHVGRDNEP